MTEIKFPANPYIIGVPLTGEAGFYGRNDVFAFIEDTIEAEQQNVIVLFGQRRIGKTSMLHQISRKLGDSDRVVAVYFDLQDKGQKRLGEVLFALARTVARTLKLPNPKRADFDNDGRHFNDIFLPSAFKQIGEKRLLLLFDEFDVLGDDLSSTHAASETLFPYLHDWIMHQRKIVFVFVVGRRIEELATHFHSIFKQAVYRRIGLLKEEHALNIITQPVKDLLTFEDKAIKAIMRLTNGHPYFTQLICYETFNDMKAKSQLVVTEKDIINTVDRAIETGHGALNWFWEGLPRPERFIMSAVAHVTDETGAATLENVRSILERHKIFLTGLELKDAPDRLVEWEMLQRQKKKGSYYFVVELVRRWILKAHPLQSARRDVDLISKRASRLYENARDAHTEGDLEYARVEYERALKANINHSGAQLGLAQVLFELDQIDRAIEEFEKAYEIDDISARDGLVRARLKKAKMLEENNRSDEAIIQYERGLRISPTDQTLHKRLMYLHIKLADTALASNDFQSASESYLQALELDKEETSLPEIKSNLGNYIKKAEAEKLYENALSVIVLYKKLLPQEKSIVSKERAIWTKWGDIFLAEKQLEKALEAFTKAHNKKKIAATQTALQREKLKANQTFALNLEKEGKWDEAIKTYKALLKTFPDNDEWQKALKHSQIQAELSRLHQQAVIAIKKKNMSSARDLLAKVIAKQPDYKDAPRLLLLAVEGIDVEKILKRHKQSEKRIRDLNKKLKDERDNHNYTSNRLRALLKEKEKGQAELKALKPDVPQTTPEKPPVSFIPDMSTLSRPDTLNNILNEDNKSSWFRFDKNNLDNAAISLRFDKKLNKLKWHTVSTGSGYLLQSSHDQEFKYAIDVYDGPDEEFEVDSRAELHTDSTVDLSTGRLPAFGLSGIFVKRNVYYRVKAKPSGSWSNVINLSIPWR